MFKIMDIALAVFLLVLSVGGMAASAWSLGPLFTSIPLSDLQMPPRAAIYLFAFALVVEGIRFFIAYNGKFLRHASPIHGVTVALPVWLLCTMYCVLIPFLALLLIPIPVLPEGVIGGLSLSWICIQLATGIMPSTLPTATPVPEVTALAAIPEARPRLPKPRARTRTAAPRKAQPKRPTVSSADELLKLLAKFTELPEGSKISKRGHVGAGGEIVLSQEELASLVQRSKSTVRRWLQELEQRQRITKLARGKKQPTRLRILRQNVVQPSFGTPRAVGHAASA